MTTSTTNRFLTNALRTLCFAGALSTCSAWATVVTWQLSSNGVGGHVGAIKALSQSGRPTAARGFDNPPVTDASHQILFTSAPAGGVSSETRTGLVDTLNTKPQASDAGTQQESLSALSQGGRQGAAGSAQPDESLLSATATAPARPATELDEALARNSFDEEFVSVPTIQFTSTAPGSREVSMASGAAGNVDPAPVPEMSALFPIVGLIVAVSCTQILRRRRAAQQGAFRPAA